MPIIGSLAAVGILLAACSSGGSTGSTSASTAGASTFGVLSCFTGRLASLGQAMIQGAQVAQKAIDDAGGVNGHPLALVQGDTGCDVAEGVTALSQMLTKSVSVVIGPETQEINGVEPVLQNSKIVDEFQGGDTSRDHQADSFLFRDSPSDSQLGVAMGLYAYSKGYRKAALLFYSDAAAQTIVKPVTDTFKKLGGTVVTTVDITPGQTSYLSQVQQVINSHPDVIFTQTDAPTAAVVFKDFGQLNGLGTPFVGTDVTSGSDYLKAITYPVAHAHLTSVYGTSVTGQASDAFTTVFNQMFPANKAAGPLANSNYAYDAVISAALAQDYAKSTDGTTVAADMSKVTNPPGTACFTYSGCLSLLKAGSKINYEGASGSLDYNHYNNVFGPYGAFQADAATGVESQVHVMSAAELATATP
jgi:ABC-type branched-subunit amino acid transport system substrate-binding protein